MMRPVLFAVAAVVLAAPAPAAPDLAGNWTFSSVGPTGETVACILKITEKDGKPSAAVVFSPEGVETTVGEFRATDAGVEVTLKQVRTFKNAKTQKELKNTTTTSFVGVRGKDPKVILGSTGDHRFRTRAKLAATDKETLGKDELAVRTPMPEPMTKAQQLSSRALLAQNRWALEKDPAKKKDLQKEASAAAREANEQMPALYREVVEKHADSPAAFDAAISLLRGAARNKIAAEDASKFVRIVRDKATPYGPLFAGVTLAPIADALAGQSGLEAVALEAIEPSAKGLTDADPAAVQSQVLSAYRNALEKAGKAPEAKAVSARLAKLEDRLDAEYLKAVPPFKPTAFAGRKDSSANQVVMLELFTGAQCPPCVAADVAFDALVKAYKPTDLVLVQYHMHIPGSDPMTNPDTVARWDYYRKLFAEDIRGVPSSLFNGKPVAGGGGGMTAAEGKFAQYAEVINPLLEKATPVKIGGKATRSGDRLDIAVDVAGGADLTLRLLVVEETVKYAGSNGIRFHHHVVRAMPGGAGGVAVKDNAFKHTATVDLAEVRTGLAQYLDKYVADNPNRPFARPDRPMDMKAVRVVAVVQNDKTGEIAQAAQFEVPAAVAGGGE